MKAYILLLSILFLNQINAKEYCNIPPQSKNFIIQEKLSALQKYPDIRRNYKMLQGLCIHLLAFREGNLVWKMFLVTNPKRSNGPFWFLPHDNENSAFDAAVYATRRYGGGFLSVSTGDHRYNMGQDPNRNFANSNHRLCSQQIAPSPRYTNFVFSTINYYKNPSYPYLALHNNTNRGGISVLKKSPKTKSYLAYPRNQVKSGIGLSDEDSIVYIAGSHPNPPQAKIQTLLNAGLNVKYEYVTAQNNDCSMSNYVVLALGSDNYYNIETQHGKSTTQIEMLNRLIHLIQRRK